MSRAKAFGLGWLSGIVALLAALVLGGSVYGWLAEGRYKRRTDREFEDYRTPFHDFENADTIPFTGDRS